MKLIFATNNAHKLAEVQAVLGEGYELVTPRQMGITEEIPETVFADMQKGIPLVYAYAYYLAAGDGESRYAEDVNKQNARMAMPPVNEADENGELTMDEVEAMPPAAVKKNYPRILKSIGKWRL